MVDDETGKVFKNGVLMKWGGKATQLFCLLLEHSPQTITKEMIFKRVWKGRVVTDNTLYKTIGNLRQELNQDGIEIESVFGEGYRMTTDQVLISKQAPEPSLVEQQPTFEQQKSKSKKLKMTLAAVLIGMALWLSFVFYGWQKNHDLTTLMLELDDHLAITKQAFVSQINRRNELGELLSKRFELKQEDSWEKRFHQLYDQMNEQELFLCQQTRAYTEGPLLNSNQAIFNLLNNNPKVAAVLPAAQQLASHLTIWLNKYERVFKDSMKMCLLYVGVEDGAHYPSEFDQQVKAWIAENQ